jgi:hypothetical protein
MDLSEITDVNYRNLHDYKTVYMQAEYFALINFSFRLFKFYITRKFILKK